MGRTLRCSWCGNAVQDDVTDPSEYSRGKDWQEVSNDDVPTLCTSCNEKAKGK